MKELLGFYAPFVSPICFILTAKYYGETMELKTLKECKQKIDEDRLSSIKVRTVLFFMVAIVTLF